MARLLFMSVVLASCSSRSTRSQINHVGFISTPELRDSIGAFGIEATDDWYFSSGTGFIIGEDESYYYGLTNQHVWNGTARVVSSS